MKINEVIDLSDIPVIGETLTTEKARERLQNAQNKFRKSLPYTDKEYRALVEFILATLNEHYACSVENLEYASNKLNQAIDCHKRAEEIFNEIIDQVNQLIKRVDNTQEKFKEASRAIIDRIGYMVNNVVDEKTDEIGEKMLNASDKMCDSIKEIQTKAIEQLKEEIHKAATDEMLSLFSDETNALRSENDALRKQIEKLAYQQQQLSNVVFKKA